MKKNTIKWLVVLVLVLFGLGIFLWGSHIMNNTEVLITDVTVKDAMKTGRQAAKPQLIFGLIAFVIAYILTYVNFKE